MNDNWEQRFSNEFQERFFDIAQMADKHDDVGYGKGLVQLMFDISDFIRQELSSQKAAIREKVEEMKVDLDAYHKLLCNPEHGCNKSNRRVNMRKMRERNDTLSKILALPELQAEENKQ